MYAVVSSETSLNIHQKTQRTSEISITPFFSPFVH